MKTLQKKILSRFIKLDHKDIFLIKEDFYGDYYQYKNQDDGFYMFKHCQDIVNNLTIDTIINNGVWSDYLKKKDKRIIKRVFKKKQKQEAKEMLATMLKYEYFCEHYSPAIFTLKRKPTIEQILFLSKKMPNIIVVSFEGNYGLCFNRNNVFNDIKERDYKSLWNTYQIIENDIPNFLIPILF